ncbi:thiolase C-terminal domain-containing protein [Roseiflexus castenholzii]|jgi:acetyl-CoA C-acetyltransferase|uniref:Acetyl-CoA acetyltransferase-like protein n=1 Tax=Roseiflexus castenholzii (strain DSM 13941 / HLO8) TaxID=383372 RepID=A7NHZ8_ROSCS|nr:acetyl-CoA acetyltransferase [Roseiflexus castenholzii]ABU57095.1 acetyl-CoA acetyltransferase-like protein [Roseiflexus castenholzii DSM 13941]
MRHVYIIGTGATAVGEHWDRNAASLAVEALTGALGTIPASRLGALYVASALSGTLHAQSQIGALIATTAGIPGVEAITVEAGGASGGVALRQACMAVASGAVDLAAVVGVEKVTDVLDARREAALALATDADWEAIHGVTLTALWALLMRRYMHEYGYAADDFAPFPINAHANGIANPHAMYRFPITADKVRSAPMVSEPLGLLDCSTAADGAAAVVIADEGLARELCANPVRIAGSAVATDTLALHCRSNPLWLAAAAQTTTAALRSAHLTHDDVQVFDITDPHGIAAALALESSGFAERGTAVALAREGAITPKGRLPLATGGGCKARGDTVGANGVYQIVELVAQLRGHAGAAQVNGARVALAQCMGGIGATVATHILTLD